MLTGGQARPAARAGDWLLEMGPARLWAGQDANGQINTSSNTSIAWPPARCGAGPAAAGDAATEVADPRRWSP